MKALMRLVREQRYPEHDDALSSAIAYLAAEVYTQKARAQIVNETFHPERQQ